MDYHIEGENGKITISFNENKALPKGLNGCIVILLYKDMYVMAYHPGRKGWEFPGGKIEENEHIKDCGIREVYEETGAKVMDLEFLGTYSVENKDKKVFSAIFLGEAAYMDKLPPNSEMERVGYFHSMPQNISFKDDVYKIVLDYIKSRNT